MGIGKTSIDWELEHIEDDCIELMNRITKFLENAEAENFSDETKAKYKAIRNEIRERLDK